MTFGFRPFFPILISAILAVLAKPSTAQVANDNELYAAYCMAILTDAAHAQAKQAAEYKHVPELSDASLAQQKRLQQRRERLRAYLVARGLLTGARDVQAVAGITLAVKRAKADREQCTAEVTRCGTDCPPAASAMDLSISFEAWKKSVDASFRCHSQCLDDAPACVSLQRCVQGDNLPF
jgi:hypothetical protein